MKATVIAGALLLVASSPSIAATCTSTVNWASLGPPGFVTFGNSFAAPASFTDCYTFTLGGPSNSFGGVLEVNTLFNKIDIDVTSVSLTGGNLTQALSDNSPLSFSFADLLAGNYEFVVSGVVTNDPGLWKVPVGYAGLLTTIVDPTPATSVAEPATLSLFGLALAGIAALRRRKAH